MGWEDTPKPQDRLLPDTIRPQRAKKNTRKWCKGKVGVEHEIEIVRHHYYASHDRKCHWWDIVLRGGEVKDRRWICYHAQRCVFCGKYVATARWGVSEAVTRNICPDFRGEA